MKINLIFKIIGLSLVVVCVLLVIVSLVNSHKYRNKQDGFAKFQTVADEDDVEVPEYRHTHFEDLVEENKVSESGITQKENEQIIEDTTTSKSESDNSVNQNNTTNVLNEISEPDDSGDIPTVFSNNDLALSKISVEELWKLTTDLGLTVDASCEFIDYNESNGYIIYKDREGTERVAVKNDGVYTTVLRKYSDI